MVRKNSFLFEILLKIINSIKYLRSTLLESLISLFELPEDNSTPDDEHFIDVEDTPGTASFQNFIFI